MTDTTQDYREELKRIRRIADQLCTAHSIERERFHHRAMLLDIIIMLGSLYLVLMVFIDPGNKQYAYSARQTGSQ